MIHKRTGAHSSFNLDTGGKYIYSENASESSDEQSDTVVDLEKSIILNPDGESLPFKLVKIYKNGDALYLTDSHALLKYQNSTMKKLDVDGIEVCSLEKPGQSFVVGAKSVTVVTISTLRVQLSADTIKQVKMLPKAK